MPTFKETVYALVARIPEGCVATYGQISLMAGRPRCARIVGQIMSHCEEPGLPCHRVIKADGSLCDGYEFGVVGLQRELLRSEGVHFTQAGRVDMAQCQWDGQ